MILEVFSNLNDSVNRRKSSNTFKISAYRKEIVCSLHSEHNELNLKCRRFKYDVWENHFMPSVMSH